MEYERTSLNHKNSFDVYLKHRWMVIALVVLFLVLIVYLLGLIIEFDTMFDFTIKVTPISNIILVGISIYFFVHLFRFGILNKPFVSLHNHQLVYYNIVLIKHKIPVGEIISVETFQSSYVDHLSLKLRDGSVRQINFKYLATRSKKIADILERSIQS